MSRTLVPAVAALSIVAAAVPPATLRAEPDVYSGGNTGQEAYAVWGTRTRSTKWPLRVTVVMAVEGVVGDSVGTYAAVATLRCPMKRARDWDPFLCRGRGKVFELRAEDFSVDPLLRSATLRIRDGRRRDRVDWSGSGTRPEVFGAPWIWEIEEGQFVNAYLHAEAYRLGTAWGRVLGRRFTARHSNSVGYLSQGTTRWVSVYPWLDRWARSGDPIPARSLLSRLFRA